MSDVLNPNRYFILKGEFMPTAKVPKGSKLTEYDEDAGLINKYVFSGTDWVLYEVNTVTGGVTVCVEGNKDLLQDNATCDGDAHCLVATSTPCKIVTIQANPANTGNIYIGVDADTDADNHMFVLTAGNSMPFTVSNLNKLFYFGAAGNKLSYGGEV